MIDNEEEVKVIAVIGKRGGWDIEFSGRITPRDMNRLKRGLKFSFGRYLRKVRLKRIAQRSVVANSEVKTATNNEPKVEVPKLNPLPKLKEPVDASRNEG